MLYGLMMLSILKKTRFGLYTSILKEPLGQHFITGATEEGVLTVTRWHLKALQDGHFYKSYQLVL